MNFKGFDNRYRLRLYFYTFIFTLFISGFIYGQDCPSFEIVSVSHTDQNQNNGSIEIKINSSKIYTLENFLIKQKESSARAELGYEVDINIALDKLTIEGLKKSEDMILEEYEVLFYDKSCKNGQLVEIGTFKIK